MCGAERDVLCLVVKVSAVSGLLWIGGKNKGRCDGMYSTNERYIRRGGYFNFAYIGPLET